MCSISPKIWCHLPSTAFQSLGILHPGNLWLLSLQTLQSPKCLYPTKLGDDCNPAGIVVFKEAGSMTMTGDWSFSDSNKMAKKRFLVGQMVFDCFFAPRPEDFEILRFGYLTVRHGSHGP